MNDKIENQQIELNDGRMLGWAEYGPSTGQPIFYFHGYPGSRLDWKLTNSDDAVLDKLNARVIAPDRPGFGLSDVMPKRTLLDWPKDVAELASGLNIDHFSVLGISGGGPYAAACAFTLGERLEKTAIVCGMGPADAPGSKQGISWTLPGKSSIVRRFVLLMMSFGLRRDPDQFMERSKQTMAGVDALLLEQPNMAAAFVEGVQEAFRNGIRGANQEAALYTRSWGFDFKEIKKEVFLWHGNQDLNVPPSVGRYAAEAIPNCQCEFLKDEGHLTLPHNNIEKIIDSVIGHSL